MFLTELKECYTLYDQNDEGVPIDSLGDVMRAMGQNPTEADVKAMIEEADGQGRKLSISPLL